MYRYDNLTLFERVVQITKDDPQGAIVVILAFLGVLLIASVGVWAAFTTFPLWGTALLIGATLLIAATFVAEW